MSSGSVVKKIRWGVAPRGWLGVVRDPHVDVFRTLDQALEEMENRGGEEDWCVFAFDAQEVIMELIAENHRLRRQATRFL